jgi:hypothetical protein
MKTVVGLFDHPTNAERAVAELRRLGIADDAVSSIGHGSDQAAGNALSERRFLGSEATAYAEAVRRGATLVTADVPDDLADTAMRVVREVGAVEVIGRAFDGDIRAERDTLARDPSEPSARNNWDAAERLESPAPYGAGAAAGGVMGAPLGDGITAAAGGTMGLAPGETPADDAPGVLPSSESQADIERQRRDADPAP